MTKSLADTLRDYIGGSGMSLRELAQETGIPQPMLHRFYKDGCDMTLGTATKLANFFGLGRASPCIV